MPDIDPATHRFYVLGFLMVGTEVLLIRKKRPGWQEDKYNGIGGALQGEETTAEAMARECREETGYQTNPSDWEPRLCFTSGERTVCVFGLYRPKLQRSDLKHHPELKTGDEAVEWRQWSWLHNSRHLLVKHVMWMLELCRERALSLPITATAEK
jgi:8-oxo-dGTP pyrophosphatase MutT (NUDIX family)